MSLWAPRDLASAAAPMVLASKAFGLAPYRYEARAVAGAGAGQRLAVSRAAQVYGCLLFATQLLALGFYFAYTPKVDCDPETSAVVSFVEDAFMIIFFLLGAIELLFANTLLPNSMTQLLADLEEIHQILLGQNKKSYVYIYFTGCMQGVAIVAGLLVMIAGDLKYSFCNAYASIAYFMIVISYTTTCLTMTQYINLTLLLYFSFKKINQLSVFAENNDSKLTTLASDPEKPPPISLIQLSASHKERLCEHLILRSIRKVHFALCAAIERINAMFSLLVAFETLSFVFTIATLMFYVVLYFDAENKTSDIWLWLLRPLTWTAPIVWKVVGVSVAGELASAQARRTAALVQRALLWGKAGVAAGAGASAGAGSRQRELEGFAAQLAASSTELRVAGGLRVDLGLLGAAASATVFYIIVMLQFYKTEFTGLPTNCTACTCKEIV